MTVMTAPNVLTFKSDPMQVRAALKSALTILAPQELLPEESGTVELVLAEVMNNIVEHAYEEADDGDIEMVVEGIPGGILCKVVDFGKPMPDGQTPLGVQADVDVEIDDLPEGGFGWFLIGELAKDLNYERRANANHLSFRMAVGNSA